MPRLVVAGLSGESGKTLVSLALLMEASRRGVPVRAFKKGPDYIDAAWLTWASGAPARNLDTWLMGFDRAAASFAWHAIPAGLNLIEGNRGLFDGSDAVGTHSTAELAKSVNAPVIVVVNATKMTRTAAAVVLGCQHLDRELWIAGVILNQVAGARHERVLREAIESACGIPVLGAIRRAAEDSLLSSRHLGLVPPEEFAGREVLKDNLADLTHGHLEFDRLLEISRLAPPLPLGRDPRPARTPGAALSIGYISDSAFTFYYPENLDALREAGADLVPISALTAPSLPDQLDALYIGGGFPETHARLLSANIGFLNSLREAARAGLPIYAECGGLMLLSKAILWQGRAYPMAQVFPFEVEVHSKPQGHGYSELVVEQPNPFFAPGTRIRGHEFHYSRIVSASPPPTACAVMRGTGCGFGRDATVTQNVWASYTHVHALGTPEWADGILRAASRFALVPA